MKYALIIGNNKYDDPKLAQLKTPAADSQALAKILDDRTIGSFDVVLPLINQNESKTRRAISEFLMDKKPDDLVLLYFSGHGVLDDRGRLYLALKDTQVSLLKATSIPSSFLADEMDSCRSKRQILILDCCHSGAFARGVKGEQKAITETTFEGSGFGRVVLTASDSTQYALEGDQVLKLTELSLFTHFLLDGLQTGQADLNQDGQVSLDEWYDYTYGRVVSETPRQVPHKWSYNQQGDLVIARNPYLKKKAAELPGELVQALDSSFVGIRESAVNELGKYLGSRDPQMAALAVSALERMKQDDSRRISSLAGSLLAGLEPPPSPRGQLSQTDEARAAPALKIKPLPESPMSMGTASPAAPPVPRAVPLPSLWLKWLGTIALGLALSAALNWFYSNTDPEPGIFALLFGAVATVTGLVQWLLLRGPLEGWWPAVNAATGLGLGGLNINLFQQTSWGYDELGKLLLIWMVLNIVTSLALLRARRPAERASIVPPAEAYRTWFMLLFSISLIAGGLASLVAVWIDIDYAKYLWVAYGILAVLAGLSFWRQRTVWNFGWILLALFLLVDGVTTGLLGLSPSPDEYPLYYFSIGGTLACAACMFFAFHRETWKALHLVLLTGYLLAAGLANLAVYETSSNPIILIVPALFGIAAAAVFLLQRWSEVLGQNSEA
jgi:hypothetical protein